MLSAVLLFIGSWTMTVSVVYPCSSCFFSPLQGWKFSEEDGLIDEVNHKNRLKEIYLMSDPEYNGKCTIPVLFDKKKKVIVNNESSEIIRMFNFEFNEFAKNPTLDLYPLEL